ncbi:MAG: cation:dicarboxylase symporter family transporter, partial [Oscillospiraceae bacterium]
MKKLSLTLKILIGFLLGIATGLALYVIMGKDATAFTGAYIQPFGTLFLNLIKMVIVPLVFSSL